MARTKQTARKSSQPARKGVKGLKKAVKTEPRAVAAKKVAKKTAAPVKKDGKEKRRTKAGVGALREIRTLQKTVNLMIPKAPFARLVREILRNVNTSMVKAKAVDENDRYRVTPQCLTALQEAAEAYLVDLFEATQLAAIHAKRVTIQQKDMSLALMLRNEMRPSGP